MCNSFCPHIDKNLLDENSFLVHPIKQLHESKIAPLDNTIEVIILYEEGEPANNL